MASDALDPGDGGYPAFPRLQDGSWDTERMPVGMHSKDGVRIDLTPRHPDRTPIVPPGMTLPATCRCASHGGS